MIKKRLLNIFCALLTMSAMSACQSDPLFDLPMVTLAKVQMSDGVAVQRTDVNRVDFLKIGDGKIKSHPLFTPDKEERIARMTAGPMPVDPGTLFVFTSPVSERQTRIGPGVVAISPSTGEVTRYDTGSYFGQNAFDPEGRFMVLFHSDEDMYATSGLFNPNEVALIDLKKAPGPKNPEIVSVDLKGAVLNNISFLGNVDIDGKVFNLAAFATNGRIKFLDLEQSPHASVTVKLKTDGDNRNITASSFVVRPATGLRSTTIFAMAQGVSEIFEMSMAATGDGFTVSNMNQQDGGSNPGDMAVVNDDGNEILVVTNARYNEVNFIDVATSDTMTQRLDDIVHRILQRKRNGKDELVLYGNDTSNIYFVDATRLGTRSKWSSAIERVSVPDGVSTSWPLDNDRLLMFSSWGSSIMILDLKSREITHLSSNGTYDWSNATVWKNMFFLQQTDGVAWLDLDTGHPEKLVLDEKVESLMIFPKEQIGMAFHKTPTGRATLFPLTRPTKESAYSVDGFYVDGMMNGEVQP